MPHDPPPKLKPEETVSAAALRTLARRLLNEMARYDRPLAARLRERVARLRVE